MWVSYQSAVFSQAYGRIVFSVAVLKVADILSRAPHGTTISLFLPARSIFLYERTWAGERGERGRERERERERQRELCY
jgi:hypothetical protein